MIVGQCAWTDKDGRCKRPIETFREPPGRLRLEPVCRVHARIIDGQSADEELQETPEDVAS